MSDAPTARLTVEPDDIDDRYHRQTLISWWEQERLAAAKVLVVGAGALGNELVKNLALLGIGTVIVIDLDTVENSNLSRCVLFREGDEGKPKVDVVAAAARELNPEITIVPVHGDVRTRFGLRLFADVDLVIGGLDNREARLYTNQCCWKTSTPWIDGAIEGLMGTMRVFLPPDSACYECTMRERDYEIINQRRACSMLTREQMLEGKVPTTATSASIVAAMQVQEAIKLLHRDRDDIPLFAGKGVAYNGLSHDTYVVTYGRREACLSHDTYDLASATHAALGATFGELLADARTRLDDAQLDLEREIVTRMTCATCNTDTPTFLPLDGLTVGEGLCPTCGAERHLELVHAITEQDVELLRMTPAEIGLPPYDIVTGRSGVTRHHYLLGGASLELLGLADR